MEKTDRKCTVCGKTVGLEHVDMSDNITICAECYDAETERVRAIYLRVKESLIDTDSPESLKFDRDRSTSGLKLLSELSKGMASGLRFGQAVVFMLEKAGISLKALFTIENTDLSRLVGM